MRPRREWIGFWAPAVLLAAPQLIGLATHARGPGVVRLFFGWLGHDDPFFPLYLLRNFGFPLLLAIPAWWVAPREWRKFYLAFLLLFIFTFVIVFSPDLLDNGKPIYYWHALNSVLVAAWLTKLATEHKQRLLAAVLAFLSVATALIVFRTETIASRRAFTDEELAVASFVRDHTGPQALFLTAPSLKSPVLSLAGRPVLRSATAWLWSHGYEFREREKRRAPNLCGHRGRCGITALLPRRLYLSRRCRTLRREGERDIFRGKLSRRFITALQSQFTMLANFAIKLHRRRVPPRANLLHAWNEILFHCSLNSRAPASLFIDFAKPVMVACLAGRSL